MTITTGDADRQHVAHPISIYSSFDQVGRTRTKDGVFSNMVSKPGGSDTSSCAGGESSAQAIPSNPPQYEEVANLRPPNYTLEPPAIFRFFSDSTGAGSSGGRVLSLSDILIDGIPLGSWASFLGPLFIVLVYPFFGFLFALMLVRSHAGHHGTFAGLGLLLALFALNGGFDANPAASNPIFGSPHDKIPPDPQTTITTSIDPYLLISLLVMGVALFLFSIYSYVRLRSRAKTSLSQLRSMEQA